MAYQPQLLPARSADALMKGLDNHFGETASLDPAVTADISAYLTANAADAGGKKNRLLRRLDDSVTPLRISEMPWWTRAHNDSRPRPTSAPAWTPPPIASPATKPLTPATTARKKATEKT